MSSPDFCQSCSVAPSYTYNGGCADCVARWTLNLPKPFRKQFIAWASKQYKHNEEWIKRRVIDIYNERKETKAA